MYVCIVFYGRWYLGIQSKKDPAHVMNEVYKAMQALRCVWHQVNNYRVLCRWQYTSGLPSGTTGNAAKAKATSPALAALAALNPLYPQYQGKSSCHKPTWAAPRATSTQAMYGALDSLVTPVMNAMIDLDNPGNNNTASMDDDGTLDQDLDSEPDDHAREEGVDDMDVDDDDENSPNNSNNNHQNNHSPSSPKRRVARHAVPSGSSSVMDMDDASVASGLHRRRPRGDSNMDDIDEDDKREEDNDEDEEEEKFVGEHAPAEPDVKIALSLYKVQQSIYLLDFQRVEVRLIDDIYAMKEI